MTEKKNNGSYSSPTLPFVPLSSVTENNVTGEKSTSGYCFFGAPVWSLRALPAQSPEWTICLCPLGL